jgi:hypothetical protein
LCSEALKITKSIMRAKEVGVGFVFPSAGSAPAGTESESAFTALIVARAQITPFEES